MNGVLYIVPTPIGNLEDITLRALKILRECDIIICETMGQSLKLLSHFKISKPLMSFHSHSEYCKLRNILSKLSVGKKIALTSNAGTPCISDPGYILVKEVIKKNIKIEVLPGSSALITALVGSGLPTNSFIFCGFLKRKSSKIKKQLSKLISLKKTIIFYESPHRILNTIKVCAEIFGEDSKICLAREITKKFEEFIRGTIKEVLEDVKNRDNLFGEFVVLVYPVNNLFTSVK
ncbi:MAG: 16S rRNA (cytidine(1402)-2'-O)-methyltransferase [Endomicrobium sp.]|jgi:16S rRNA (cytidine1402-2'-O)-methyltransferase|nr:16S rRNA (cytidine(1402)-2'-O)-methyltransferase [Endomicrobium sp.]